jgi:hypothetical protein
MSVPAQFASFREFYPWYLSEHGHRVSRRLHFLGTGAFVAQWLLAPLLGNPWLLLSGPLTAYVFAWTGHFFFEKNRPATFAHPVYSLLGDFAMFRDLLAGRIRW